MRRPDFMTLSGSRIKDGGRIWAVLPAHLETALCRLPWMLVSSSCTFEAAITPPSGPPCREVLVSTRAILIWEISCSVSKVTWTSAPVPFWKSEEMIMNPFIGTIQSGITRQQRSLESKWDWKSNELT